MTYFSVTTGLDHAVGAGFPFLNGKTVALITNHTGQTTQGRSVVDLLHSAPNVKLVSLFTPEHGLRGQDDDAVSDGVDVATGLPVCSLYGPRQQPDASQLQEIDLLVYDIQDAGCRFYTYISTLLWCMKAASTTGIGLLVLDRPNPLGGAAVEGPLPDPEKLSFVACHTIPLRHGLTVGELARLFNHELSLNVDLTVEPVRGWQRSMMWSDTLLPWVNPSPNLRSPTQALLYPGAALCEFTNLAVGRGTDTPFQLIGAPWIDGRRLALKLHSQEFGIAASPVRFVPRARHYEDVMCGGILLEVTDRTRVKPVAFGLRLVLALLDLYPEKWQPENLMTLLANESVYNQLLAGTTVAEIEEGWQPTLQRYRERIVPHLIYH
jgi:uncharacterized protein YbbC (DUF1343 family)